MPSDVGSAAWTRPALVIGGDYTRDGVVDGANFLAWQRQNGFAVTVPKPCADGDGSGVIDGADEAIWANDFGVSFASTGDYTQDGILDGADFLAWQRALRGYDLRADGAHDGVVDGNDLKYWSSRFVAPNAVGLIVPLTDPTASTEEGTSAIGGTSRSRAVDEAFASIGASAPANPADPASEISYRRQRSRRPVRASY